MPKGISDELHKLVHSLSKSEKVYFNTYSNAFAKGTDPQHLHLFRILCRQTEYNETEVLNNFKTISQNHLSALKNQLQQLILKCLNDYHSEMNVEIELQENIHSINILVEKRLLRMAAKLLLKGKKLALDHEKYEYLHILSSLELRIIKTDSDAKKLKVYMKTENKNRKTYIENIENSFQFDSLSLPLWEILLDNSSGTVRKNRSRIKGILQNRLLSSLPKDLPFSSRYEYYYLHFLCNDFLDKRDEKLYLQQREWLDYLESQPHKLIERRMYFVNALSRLIMIAGEIGRIKDSEFLFRRAQNFILELPASVKNKNIMARVVALTNNYMHNHLIIGNARNVLDAWERLKEMTPSRSVSIYSNAVTNNNLFYAHFLLQQYHEALGYLNKVIDLKSDVRSDLQQQGRIASLILHYELHNLEQLPYMVRSAAHYLKRRKESSRSDKLIFRYFERSIPGITNKREEKEVFGKLKVELDLVLVSGKSKSNSNTRNSTLFNLIYDWVESKAENKTYAEVVKGKAKKVLGY